MPLGAAVIAEGEGRSHLIAALTLAMDDHYGNPGTANHWKVDTSGLGFGWHKECGGYPLPYPMVCEEVATFILSWISKVEFPREPDIDGSVERDWRLRSIGFSEGNNPNQYFLFWVKPVWIEYHK